MGSEIRWRHDLSGATLYATIRNGSGQYWSGEAFEDLNPANWGDYDIALSESAAGGHLSAGTFPAAVAAGAYTLEVFEQSGGSPDIGDSLRATLHAWWDGAALRLDPAAALAADVDSTGMPISAGKVLEIALAVLMGKAAFNSTTNTWSVYGRDGSTVLAEIVLTGGGSRNSPTL